ncbi:MAG: hypothetical protein ACFE9L_14850, partial [Candidatus Hodarchaeota archaeon]
QEEIMAFNMINCSLCNQCVDICELDAVSVSTSGNEFVFMIEGTGTLTIDAVLDSSLKLLKEKTEEFKNLVEEF